MGWQKDKDRSDVFMPQVRRALADRLILIGDVRQDREEGTDLVILRTDPKTVGVRIRDVAKYWEKYRFEITVRSSRPSGVKTELQKLEEGWIDLIFYGFGDYSTGTLKAYRVLDCRALRAQMIRRDPPLRFKDQPNRDGSSCFRAYDCRSFGPGVEVEKWADPDLLAA